MSDLTENQAAALCGLIVCGPFALAAGFMVLAAVLVKWVLS